MLFPRALASFLILPGLFAGLLPWLLVRGDASAGDGSPWDGWSRGWARYRAAAPRWWPRLRPWRGA